MVNSFAQLNGIVEGPPFNFLFQDATVSCQEIECIDVLVENFTDVSSFQIAAGYDDELFRFDNVISSELLPGIDLFGLSALNMEGRPVITVLFTNFVGTTTIKDNTVLFSLCFQALGEEGDASIIAGLDLISNGEPIQIFTSSGTYGAPELNVVSSVFTIEEGDSCLQTSAADLSVLSDLVLYPNPVVDKLYLETTEQNLNYQILNLQGQQIMEGLYQNSIQVEQVPSGIFFLQLQKENELYEAIKFVKE